jgi:hypothetical protein
MINEILKIFSLIFSVVGAIFLGRAQGKRKEQQKQLIEKIEQENENLKQIIEVEKGVSDMSDIDRIEFLQATTQNSDSK